MIIPKVLFKLARTRLGNSMVRWSFAHATKLMPVDKLHETDLVIAFRHPQPSHETHIVIVPKRSIKTLMHLSGDDADVLRDVFLSAQKVIQDLGLESQGYSVVVNGGPRQDVDQIHFHILSGEPLDERNDG